MESHNLIDTNALRLRALTREDVDELLRIGQRLATRKLYDSAVKVFAVALQAEPQNRELRELLAEAQALAGDAQARPESDHLSDQSRRNGIDASHFMGLAALYADRGEHSAALECLEMSKEKAPALPYPHKLHGKLLLKRKDYDGAALELYRALRFNPFDRQVAEYLSRIEYERGNYAAALEFTVDAFLLLADEQCETASRLRRRVRSLKRLLGWTHHSLIRLFRERQQKLTTAFDRLRWRRDLFLEERGLLERGLLFGTRPFHQGGARISMAGRLRQIPQWAHLTDEAIFKITDTVEEEVLEADATVYEAGTNDRDLFYLESGAVSVQRVTPYGSFVMYQHQPREMFGQTAFVDRLGRSNEAITLRRSQLLRLDADHLDQLISASPGLGVQVYTGVWQSLASRLRQTNERLKGFFPDQHSQQSTDRLLPTPLGAIPVEVESRDKVRLFREQGLSRKELLTLATFAKERRYGSGNYLFREGEAGGEMFFILEGKIRISQFTPGGGEEALAILGRGEFFGEMALIDGEPRSADARTHEGPATVLALDRSTIHEVLRMDPDAALQFQRLMCRILASRLREIGEKIILWQILSRHDHQSLSDAPR